MEKKNGSSHKSNWIHWFGGTINDCFLLLLLKKRKISYHFESIQINIPELMKAVGRYRH